MTGRRRKGKAICSLSNPGRCIKVLSLYQETNKIKAAKSRLLWDVSWSAVLSPERLSFPRAEVISLLGPLFTDPRGFGSIHVIGSVFLNTALSYHIYSSYISANKTMNIDIITAASDTEHLAKHTAPDLVPVSISSEQPPNKQAENFRTLPVCLNLRLSPPTP